MSNKKKFKIIPAIDLMDGVVVHGLRGERSRYRPVKSVLTSSADFHNVLDAFNKHFGLTEFYIADLDAIISSGQKDQLKLIDFCARENSYKFWVDAGIRDFASAEKVFKAEVHKAVVGTETLVAYEALQEIVAVFGAERVAVSIDIKDGRVLSPSSSIAGLKPPEAIKMLKKTGMREFILLELDKVGTCSGPDIPLIRECLASLYEEGNRDETLILGGSISGYEDIRRLSHEGVGGALIASVFHNGTLTQKSLRKQAFLSDKAR